MSLDPVALQALDLPTLRERLAAHQAGRPVDIFSAGMADWIADKAKLRFAIERKEGELTSPPFFITVPPKPMEGIRIQPELDFRRLTHRKPVEPIEAPMDPTPSYERLQRLLARLAKNDADQNDAAAYTTRADIRRFCEAEGLPVPPEARKRDPLAAKQAKAAARAQKRTPTPAPATAPPASASPAAPVVHGAEPPRAQSATHCLVPGTELFPIHPHPPPSLPGVLGLDRLRMGASQGNRAGHPSFTCGPHPGPTQPGAGDPPRAGGSQPRVRRLGPGGAGPPGEDAAPGWRSHRP